VLGLESALGFLVRPPLEHVSGAPDCAAVGHEKNALPLHRTREFLEECVDPLAHLGKAFATGRLREEGTERGPVVLQPRKRHCRLSVRHVVRVSLIALADEQVMTHAHVITDVRRVRRKYRSGRINGALVAGKVDLIERTESIAYRDARLLRLSPPRLGESNQVTGMPRSDHRASSSRKKRLRFRAMLRWRFAVANEDEQSGSRSQLSVVPQFPVDWFLGVVRPDAERLKHLPPRNVPHCGHIRLDPFPAFGSHNK
jgi:hypothetical protein